MATLRITAVELRRHGGAMSRVANAHASWSARQGVLVQLCDDQGHRGLGEASPLPGHSPDDLAACEAELRGLDGAGLAVELDDFAAGHGAGHGAGRARLVEVTGRLRAPAARFALETALLDLVGQRAGRPLWQVLRALGPQGPDGAAPEPVPLNAVCAQGDPARVVDDVAAVLERGIRCIKLKVGRDFDRELAALEAVRAHHGDEIALRVDANQAWHPAEARAHLQRLAAVAPEYVEEPVVEPMAHLAGLAPLPVPVALDESLVQAFSDSGTTPAAPVPDLDALLAAGLVRVLVLKPMLLGGALPALALAARARAHGAAAVVSHLFDGPVALAACAHLAVALAATRACGLDRHNGLQAWPEIAISFVGQARIAVPHQPGLGVSAPIEARP